MEEIGQGTKKENAGKRKKHPRKRERSDNVVEAFSFPYLIARM